MKKDFSANHTSLSGHEILNLEGQSNFTFNSLSQLPDSALMAGHEAYVKLKHVNGEFMQQPQSLPLEHFRVFMFVLGLPALLTWVIATKLNAISAAIMLPLWLAFGVRALSNMRRELQSSDNKRLGYGRLLAFSRAVKLPMDEITKMDLAACSILFTAKFKDKVDKVNAEVERQRSEESAAYFKAAAGRGPRKSARATGSNRRRAHGAAYENDFFDDGFDRYATTSPARFSASGIDTGRIDSETNMSISLADDHT